MDKRFSIHIVLVHPDIPQNTGNIARLTAANRVALHLIHPMGFTIDEKRVRRAGLDYWPMVDLSEHDSWESFYRGREDGSFRFFSTKAQRDLFETRLLPEATRLAGRGLSDSRDIYLVFGSETAGLPDWYFTAFPEQFTKIPMSEPGVRSLNLANAVAIGLYEAIRQKREATSSPDD